MANGRLGMREGDDTSPSLAKLCAGRPVVEAVRRNATRCATVGILESQAAL